MRDFSPSARIALRYGVGIVAGAIVAVMLPDLGFEWAFDLARRLSEDRDLVAVVAAVIAGCVEGWYARDKKKGGPT